MKDNAVGFFYFSPGLVFVAIRVRTAVVVELVLDTFSIDFLKSGLIVLWSVWQPSPRQPGKV